MVKVSRRASGAGGVSRWLAFYPARVARTHHKPSRQPQLGLAPASPSVIRDLPLDTRKVLNP